MCGLVGFLGRDTDSGRDDDVAHLKKMADTIIHRGPNSEGYWCDAAQRIGLGHRRLSILDLSPAGHQPMVSPSGRYVIAFNGEIYNHLELRRELEVEASIPSSSPVNSREKVPWKGHSDTETVLAGFEVWGIRGTVERAVGMFAIAVWDRQRNVLTLARDRVGEKPLYYGWQGDTFLFGSELKALRAHPAFRAQIDRGALSLFLRHNYIPSPYSIYQGIAKLPPSALLTISPGRHDPEIVTYWSAAQVAVSGALDVFSGTPTQAVDELERLLMGAVRQQMMADVPLGAFLSGGVDSSTIVALMQAQSSRPVKTFSIGFDEQGYNEAGYAKVVAQHLGTEHTELYVTPEQAISVIPRLPALYDEPFSDSSQIPTFLVSQLARRHVTVSLSGDAGDELFCGYTRYQVAAGLWKKLSRLPIPFRRLIARGLTALSPQTWTRIGGYLPAFNGLGNVGDRLHKAAGVLASASIKDLYVGLVSHWDDPTSIVAGGYEPPTLLTSNAPELGCLDPIQRMMLLDTLMYLSDDILVKVDRAAMATSLEGRMPFLDHRVIEFAWRLPQSVKLREGQSKWVLRQVLYRHVPRKLIERPKMGFGVPLHDWLREGLREWAESLLNENRLRQEGYFHPAPIRKKWAEHLSGQRNWAYQIWDVLMFQAWLERNGSCPEKCSE